MMQPPVRTVAPTVLPVTLAEAKAHLRVTESTEDTAIGAYLAAAVERLDGWSGVLGRCLVTQTWVQKLDGFPDGDIIQLPFPDVQSVVVTYKDAAGATQTLAGSSYQLSADAISATLVLVDGQTWPDTAVATDAVTITMVVGYGAPEAVPVPIKLAILMHITSMFDHRTAAGEGAPMAYDMLIAPYRRVGL